MLDIRRRLERHCLLNRTQTQGSYSRTGAAQLVNGSLKWQRAACKQADDNE